MIVVSISNIFHWYLELRKLCSFIRLVAFQWGFKESGGRVIVESFKIYEETRHFVITFVYLDYVS